MRDDIDRVVADLAIRRLVARYAQLDDDGNLDELSELFVEECWLDAAGQRSNGRVQVKAFVRKAVLGRKLRHVMTNHLVTVEGPSLASGSADLLLLEAAPDGEWVVAGSHRYQDCYLRGSDGEWRFRSRQITPWQKSTAGSTTGEP